MREDHIDFSIKTLARDYQRRLIAAKAAYPNDPKRAGNKAQADWIADVRSRGGVAIKSEPRTGVDSAGGGQSRFDLLFNLHGIDIYVEVQATDYKGGHKPVQLQGQVIGFAEVSAGAGVPARYYKIVGKPQRIYRLSRLGAQKGLSKGDYELEMFY